MTFLEETIEYNFYMITSVLIVEQDPLTRHTITLMLETMKYACVSVADAEQAYRVLEEVAVDIAVITLEAGDREGIGMTGELRARQQDIGVILVNGGAASEKRSPFVDAFIRKPFSLQAIDEAIARIKVSKGLQRYLN